MSVKAGFATPMLSVADVPRSIRFYSRLGFELVDCYPAAACPGWARMHCEGAAVMLSHSDEPVETRELPFLLYLYTPDLPALRAELEAAGLNPSPIRRPEHMPSGELHLSDPDGYSIFIGHWGDAQHQEWLAGREARIQGFR